ncbi:ubiquinone biosynthesis protein UbiB [Gottschalkia acidurici 9a]|uniref:Ubiquinone biosynthesis protein UbiB n=1 Tax=Gottschalkia acidurici (strain ATCC 7906 / DSM 604 / BCRC 14475 / CIP 104303 / KCTC 5404 / NCIMB 10678 / 9a) TaxID=1128398 RepID=K0B0Z5_GOTA9|nr:AarF/UbiB family protein [Gottschalkia acidurici]AFS78747.1 ubiquinone biosynthesis protein UbiB [Gottschalkia acidurici 9a]
MEGFRITTKYKNIKRYKEILSILSKYGFEMVAEIIGEGIPFKRIRDKFVKRLSRGERIKLALQELGPTFVKLGQILSTRYDLIPEDIVEELMSLQDNVNEFSVEEVRKVFNTETGYFIEDVFDEFQEKPLAAASIGQVHKGKLKTGESVVIKIQRPNIKEVIDNDISVLRSMARIIDDKFNKEGIIKASDIIRELAYSLNRELDYTYEAHNAHKFRENFKENKNILIPKIYWDYTTRKILIMEEINGIKVIDIKSIEERGWNKEKISEIGAKLFMEQVLLYGLFHGDPHPGNILVVSEDVISFIDFGVVGYLDNLMLELIITCLKAASDKNINKIVEELSDIDMITSETDEVSLKSDIYNIINFYFDLPINKIDFAEGLNELLIILYKHKLRIPPQLTLLVKSIVTIEGTARILNPQFDFMNISKKIIKEVNLKKLKDLNFLDGAKVISNAYDSLKKAPKQLFSLLNKAEKNKIKVTLKHEGLENLEKEVNTMTNKLSLSLMISSLILGSSIVIHAGMKPKIFGVSALGIVGYIVGLIIGFLFIISAIRSWKSKSKRGN